MGSTPSKLSPKHISKPAEQENGRGMPYPKAASSNAYEDVDMTNARLHWNEKVHLVQKAMREQEKRHL